MILKHLLLPVITTIFLTQAFAQDIFNPYELMVMEGQWTGVYTFLDNKTQRPVSEDLDVNMKVDFSQNTVYMLKYFLEEKYETIDTIPFTDLTFNNSEVSKYVKNADGSITMVTINPDTNIPPTKSKRLTYTLHKNMLSIREDVKFNGNPNWILHSEYLFDRKK